MPISATGEVRAPAVSGEGQNRKLAKAAQEFEAILLQNWLSSMSKGFLGTGQDSDPAHDTISSMGTQAVASALADRGGIGIAKMVLRQLSGAASGSETATSHRLINNLPLLGAKAADAGSGGGED